MHKITRVMNQPKTDAKVIHTMYTGLRTIGTTTPTTINNDPIPRNNQPQSFPFQKKYPAKASITTPIMIPN